MDRLVNLFRKKGQLLEETMDGSYYQTLPVSFGVDYSSHRNPHNLSSFPTAKSMSQRTNDNLLAHSFSLGQHLETMGNTDPAKIDENHAKSRSGNFKTKEPPSNEPVGSTSRRRQHFREGKTVSSPIATVSPMQSFRYSSLNTEAHEDASTRRKKLNFKPKFVDFSTTSSKKVSYSQDEKISLINSVAKDGVKHGAETQQSTLPDSILYSEPSKVHPTECSLSPLIQKNSKSNRKERRSGVAKLAKLLDKTGSFSKEASKPQVLQPDKPMVTPSSPAVSPEQGIIRPLATVEPLPLSNLPKQLLSPKSKSFISSLETISPCRSLQGPIDKATSSFIKKDSSSSVPDNTLDESERKSIQSTTCTIEVNVKDTSLSSNGTSNSSLANITSQKQISLMECGVDDQCDPLPESIKSFTSSCKIMFPMTRSNPVPLRKNVTSSPEPQLLEDPSIVPVTQRAQLFHSSATVDNCSTSESNKHFQVPSQRIELEEELQLLRKSRKVAFRNPAARMSLDVSALAPLRREPSISPTLPRSLDVAVLETLEFAKVDPTIDETCGVNVAQHEPKLTHVSEEEKPSAARPSMSSAFLSGNARKLVSYKQRRKTQPITIDDIAALNLKILMSEESSASEDEEWRNLVQANRHH